MERKRCHGFLKKSTCIVLCICFALVMGFISCCWIADSQEHNRSRNLNGAHIHDREFEKTLQVKGLDYDAVVARYGESDRKDARIGRNGHADHYSMQYPGFSMTYVLVDYSVTQDSGRSPVLVLLTITDDCYRFGKRQIGVGSTREEIAAAFASAKKIEADELVYSAWDFPEVDEGWYGDGWSRILFQYDANDRVEAMAYEPSAFW